MLVPNENLSSTANETQLEQSASINPTNLFRKLITGFRRKFIDNAPDIIKTEAQKPLPREVKSVNNILSRETLDSLHISFEARTREFQKMSPEEAIQMINNSPKLHQKYIWQMLIGSSIETGEDYSIISSDTKALTLALSTIAKQSPQIITGNHKSNIITNHLDRLFTANRLDMIINPK
jgi:hypothetical protein